MRSFNANFNAERSNRANGPKPINLVTFGFSTPRYISDRDVTPPGGPFHAGLLQDWSYIDSAVSQTPGKGVLGELEIPDLQLTLINTTEPRFSDNFTNEDPPENVTVEVYQWFEGLSYTEAEIIYKGIIQGQPRYNEYSCSLTIVGIFAKYNHLIGENLVICAENYPKAAPADIGKMLPIGYGHIKKMPFRAIEVAGITSLCTDIDSATQTIKVSDASVLPAEGKIYIDTEKIVYTGKTGDTLTGCIRGADSSIATLHVKGAAVVEVVSEYIYAMAHPVKAINAVYAAGVKQEPSAYTAYTGQTGDQHPAYGGRAVISFPERPYFRRAALAETEYTISREAENVPIGRAKSLDHNGYILDYDDAQTITFPSAPDGSLTDISVTYNFEFRQFGIPAGKRNFFLDGVLIATYDEGTLTQFVRSPLVVKKTSWPTSAQKSISWRNGNMEGIIFTVLSATVRCKSSVDDYVQRGALVSYAAINVPCGQISSQTVADTSGSVIFPSPPSGTLSDIAITITWEFQQWGDPIIGGKPHYMAIDGINVLWVDASGNTQALMPSTFTLLKNSWQTSIRKTPSRLNEFGRGEAFVISRAVQSCYTDDFQYNTQLAGGDITNLITADIDGYQDDASGSYTGTPGALIERPDCVLRHLWCEILGAPSGDIDLTTFDAAGLFYSTYSYAFSLVIDKPILAADLLMRLALQCRSRFLVTPYGIAKLMVRQIGQSSGHSLLKEEIKRDSLSVTRSPVTELVNNFNIYYDKDHSVDSNMAKNYRAVKNFSDATSISKYGQKEWKGRADIFFFDAIVLDAMAQHVGDFLLSYHSVVRRCPRFQVFLDNLEIEPGDIIDITHPLDSMKGFVCEVLKISHQLGSGRKKLIDCLTIIAVEN